MDNGLAQGHRFNQLQAMGWHEKRFAHLAGPVATASRPLNHSRHAFGTAHLHDRIHWAEVHAQIERGRAHHGAQPAVVQRIFHPFPEFAGNGPVVHGHETCPLRLVVEQRLVPHLGLPSGVCENEGALMCLHDLGHFVEQLQSDVPGPWKFRKRLRHGALDLDVLVDVRTNQCPFRRPHQRLKCELRLGQGGADAPHTHVPLRVASCHPRHGQFDLHTALGPKQLMPLVDHHGLRLGQAFCAALLGNQDVQGLGGRDQNVRQCCALFGLLLGRGVPRSRAHFPVQPQTRNHGPGSIGDVCGQGTQRRHPYQLNPSRGSL